MMSGKMKRDPEEEKAEVDLPLRFYATRIYIPDRHT